MGDSRATQPPRQDGKMEFTWQWDAWWPYKTLCWLLVSLKLTSAQRAGSHLSVPNPQDKEFSFLSFLSISCCSIPPAEESWQKKKKKNPVLCYWCSYRDIYKPAQKRELLLKPVVSCSTAKNWNQKMLIIFFPQRNPHQPQAECLPRKPKFSTANNRAYT